MSRPGEGEPSRRTVIEGVALVASAYGSGRTSLIVDADGGSVLVSLDATSRTTVRLSTGQADELCAAIVLARAA